MKRPATYVAVVCLAVCLFSANRVLAHSAAKIDSHRSIADRSVVWPAWDQWSRVFLLEDYNTRVVILGATLLGCAAGMVGSFTLLRKRALMGDALSHAALPGIGLAFIITTSLGGDGKSLPILLLGATITGLIGVGAILSIRNLTRLKEDTALGAVLSVFFGAGIALLGVIQQMREGHAAGLESFIYGKTASMGVQDTVVIAATALVCIGTCLLLFKEFKLLCFDEGFAGSKGLPVLRLDLALMAVVVIVCIAGLQAVGLILMVALLVIPAAAARFWTERMGRMIVISGGLGAAGATVGAGISALFSKLPSGAMIVLVCMMFFLFSMVFGSARGVLVRLLRRGRLNRAVDRQHLLRAMYEILEATTSLPSNQLRAPNQTHSGPVSTRDLLPKRSWSLKHLGRSLRRAQRAQLVERQVEGFRLTEQGIEEAARLTRQHRLWEIYLITYAEIAPSRVDRDADAIEHVLEPEVVTELESLLQESHPGIPASPHELVSPHGDALTTAGEGY